MVSVVHVAVPIGGGTNIRVDGDDLQPRKQAGSERPESSSPDCHFSRNWQPLQPLVTYRLKNCTKSLLLLLHTTD